MSLFRVRMAMRTSSKQPSTESGKDRQSIFARLRDAGLFAWTVASAIYVVTVYITYCSPFGSSADKTAVRSIDAGDGSLGTPHDQGPSRDQDPSRGQGTSREQGFTLDDDDRIREARRIDDEIREFVIEKHSRQQQPLPGDEVFNEHRMQRILEISSQLEGVTEFPEGSLQWQRRNRLEQLESNQNH